MIRNGFIYPLESDDRFRKKVRDVISEAAAIWTHDLPLLKFRREPAGSTSTLRATPT